MAMTLQRMQSCLSFGGQTIENAKGLHASQDAFTATVDGNVIACIGLIEFWPGRRMAWAYLAQGVSAHIAELTDAVQRWLRYHGDGRIEAYIDPSYRCAKRWARKLGFEREGPLRQWVPGKDYDMYARIGR